MHNFKRSFLIMAVLMLFFFAEVFAEDQVAPIKFPYINAAMISAIKKNHKAIISYYRQNSEHFKNDLGPSFSKLNEDGFKLAFSSIVAYRTAPYGSSALVPQINKILRFKFLNCGNYPLLAYDYFHILAPHSGAEIHFIGWNGGAVGNHQQLFASKTGLPLLLDPTIGLIAVATFDQIAEGKPILEANIVDAYSRKDIDAFDKMVHQALIAGLYKPSDLLYYFGTHKQAFQQNLKQLWATPQYIPLLKTLATNHHQQKTLTHRKMP